MTSVGDKVLDFINTLDDPEKFNSEVSCEGAFLDMIPGQDEFEDDEYVLNLISDFRDSFCDHGSYCDGCKFYQKLTEIEEEDDEQKSETNELESS